MGRHTSAVKASAPIERPDRRGRRGVRITVAVILLLALLPLGYVFSSLWTSTRDAERFNTLQRSGVDHIRPLTTLLVALVTAQGEAVRGEPVPADAVRDAVNEVNRIDQESGDPLRVRPRWSQLRGEVESALRRGATGGNALRAYAAPIGLTQALLSRIGDVSMIVRDPRANTHYLIDTAVVSVPEVIVNAGQVTGFPGSADTVDPRIVVALDRISRAAEAIGAGPRSGAGETTGSPATMNMLEPLDEFTAATDGLVQAASEPDPSARQPLDDLDRAVGRLQQAALRLDAAALDALETLLERRQAGLAAQRRNTVVAGLLLFVAAAVLLWWLWPRLIRSTRHENQAESVLTAEDSLDVPASLAGVGATQAVLSRGPR